MKLIQEITKESFLFDIPLYTKFAIFNDSFDSLDRLINSKFEVEGFSPFINQQTTYSVSPDSTVTALRAVYFYRGIKTLRLECKRGKGNIVVFINVVDYGSNGEGHLGHIEKIGQIPSIADLHIAQFKEFKKVIDNDSLKEITRAIGLAANGVGIGSFVYLRRIIEMLVYEAFVIAKDSIGKSEQEFYVLRMDERIQLLKGYIPDFLVANSKIYSILSKGVHELSEDECKEYFPVLLKSVRMILEQKKENEEKKSVEASTQKEIDAILEKLKNK